MGEPGFFGRGFAFRLRSFGIRGILSWLIFLSLGDIEWLNSFRLVVVFKYHPTDEDDHDDKDTDNETGPKPDTLQEGLPLEFLYFFL